MPISRIEPLSIVCGVARLFAAVCLLCASAAANAASGDGLTGTYYDQDGDPRDYFTGDTVVRVDPTVDFNWDYGNPGAGTGNDDFSVRWTGYIRTPDYAGADGQCFRFRTRSDDGVRLNIDGNSVIDNWSDHGATNDDNNCVNLNKDTYYPVTLEYYERGGRAVIELYWDPPGGANTFVIIPQSNLYTALPVQMLSVDVGGTSCGSTDIVEVTFSRAMQTGGGANGAENTANYSIPGVTINSVTLDGSGTIATLNIGGGGLTSGQNYTLNVSNVRAADGGQLDPDPSSDSFTANTGTLEPGLLGTYHDNATLSGVGVEQVDDNIDFDWGGGRPAGVGITNNNTYSVAWEGVIDIPANNYMVFDTVSDDGVRLYVDGNLLIDNWNSPTTNASSGATAAFSAGGSYDIRLEYYEGTGQANVQLQWRVCTGNIFGCFFWDNYQITGVVPASAFSYCAQSAGVTQFGISIGGGTASTCSPMSVDITALDVNNQPVVDYTGTVNISVSSGNGDWALATGSGSFTGGSADSGDATYTFATTDGGSATFDFSNTHADDLTISVNDSALGVTSISNNVSFRDNAFVIAATDPLGEEVVAGRPHQLQAQMWQRDTTTGNCAVAANYDGAVDLRAWLSRDVQDPGGVAPLADATSLPDAQPGTRNLTLNFTDGLADFALNTTDVGKYAINLLDDTRVFANAVDIAGQSNVLTVRPFALSIRNADASGTPNPGGGGVFTAAGEAFDAELAAVAWQAGDDGDDNGVPDDLTETLSDNPVTVSYATESTISFGRTDPLGSADGSFGNVVVPNGSFTNGVAPITGMTYSEVGNIILAADAADYLGSGNDITGHSGIIGRFVPAYFETTVTAHGCSAGFTYSGQPLGGVDITARNTAGNTTLNYDSGAGGFAQTVTFNDGDGSLTGSLSNHVIAATAFNAGKAVNTQPVFTLANKESASGNFILRATDTDSVTSDGHTEGQTEIRGGRLRVQDATTAVLADLDVPVIAEWWQEVTPGNYDWDVNTDDSCTTVGAGIVTLDNHSGNLDPVETSVLGTSFNSGTGAITLSAPGVGNSGQVDVNVDTETWLEYDWNGSGEEDPEGVARFEDVYKSEDGFIDRQEVIQ